jgi:hypothetical protein
MSKITARGPSARPSTAVPPRRHAKRFVGTYLHPDFHRRLLLVRGHTGQTMQKVLEDALNDLFVKHALPPVVEG